MLVYSLHEAIQQELRNYDVQNASVFIMLCPWTRKRSKTLLYIYKDDDWYRSVLRPPNMDSHFFMSKI